MAQAGRSASCLGQSEVDLSNTWFRHLKFHKIRLNKKFNEAILECLIRFFYVSFHRFEDLTIADLQALHASK